MQARPLQIYKIPAYPTRLEVLADPHLLKENIPPAWRFAPQMVGVVALMLAVNACVGADSQSASRPGATQPGATTAAVSSEPHLAPLDPAVVAPIFQHGDGRGATGCVVVSPPIFLSEEEALQIITEEFSRAGIEVTGKNVDLEGVSIQWLEFEYKLEDDILQKEFYEIGMASPLVADLVDENRAIAIEYVSMHDYNQVRREASLSSVSSYDTQEVAQAVASTVEKEGKSVYFGTFYDPMVRFEHDSASSWEEAEAAGEAEAKELLRQQIQDFIEWLQAQGVI